MNSLKKLQAEVDPSNTKTDDLTDTIKSAMHQVKKEKLDSSIDDMLGVKGKGVKITASRSGKDYWIRPCSLNEVEDVTKLVAIYEETMKQLGEKASPLEFMKYNDYAPLKAMMQLIRIGLPDDCDLTETQIGDEFTLGDFPKVFKVILDLNDFLAGMSTLYQN